MNLVIDALNLAGAWFVGFAGPMLLQSSLLIVLLFMLEAGLRRRLRPAVRYGLWLLVLLKLVLPPSLAVPTGAAFWLRRDSPQWRASNHPQVQVRVSPAGGQVSSGRAFAPVECWANLQAEGWLFCGWWGMAGALALTMARRAARVRAWAHAMTDAPPGLCSLLEDARRQLGVRSRVALGLSAGGDSPTLCGLARPVICLPRELAEELPRQSLRAVLVHELIHLKRGDLWLNHLQALLQILYWWHPLVWLANARIRRVREEAVDEAVSVALGDAAEAYPDTLLQVARFCVAQRAPSLGLLGIMESRQALKSRLQLLLDGAISRRARIGPAGLLAIGVFAFVALPMGGAPAVEKPATPEAPAQPASAEPAAVHPPNSAAGILVVTVADGEPAYYLGGEGMSLEMLKSRMTSWRENHTNSVLAIRADKDVSLTKLVALLDAMQPTSAEPIAAPATTTASPTQQMDIRMLMRYGLLPKGFKLVQETNAGPIAAPATATASPTQQWDIRMLMRYGILPKGFKLVQETNGGTAALPANPTPSPAPALPQQMNEAMLRRYGLRPSPTKAAAAFVIQARFLAAKPDAIDDLVKGAAASSNSAGDRVWVLSPEQLAALLQRMRGDAAIATLSSPRVSTPDGTQAVISSTETGDDSTAGRVYSLQVKPNLQGEAIHLSLELTVATPFVASPSPAPEKSVAASLAEAALSAQALVRDGGALAVHSRHAQTKEGRDYFFLVTVQREKVSASEP